MNPDSDTTEELIAYLRDELKPDVRSGLEARLIRDESLRRTLIELSTEEVALADWAKAERASAALDDETFAADPIPEAHVTRLPPPSPLARWWAAAAVLVIGALGFFAVNQNPPASASLPGVAHLVASVDAHWQGDQPLLNRPMTTGSYELQSGAADLLFADGARVTVSGPAVFDLRSSRHLHLSGGNLVAQIPDEALGFIVTSPQSEVVDLGTEFGLSVDATGLTDVHVLDGLVEVLPAVGNPATGQSSRVMITEGEARRFSDNPDVNGSTIPVSSRDGLVGKQRSSEIGLDMLRGSVRVVDQISRNDLFDVSEGFNWIDLAVEQRDVPL
ncbi:MAG: FecR domain-containing protein, partial [Verrucomicrobiota bacterium]